MKADKFSLTGQGMQLLEAYAAKPGFLQQTPGVCKVAFTLCFILAVVSTQKYNWPGLIPFAAFPVVGVLLVGLPFRLFLKRLLVAFPFVAVFGVINIFLDTQTVSYTIGFSLNGGIASFIVLFLKVILTVGIVQVLIASTPLNTIAATLVSLGVPGLFVMQLTLTWRYAGLLTRQAGQMSGAYRLRGGRSRGISITIWPQFIAAFLLRSMDRASAVGDAMNCRLFDVRNIRYTKAALGLSELILWVPACCLCFGLRLWLGHS